MKKILSNRHILRDPALALAWNVLIFAAARWINLHRAHYDMTCALDRRVPFLPWTGLPYLSCFGFWYVGFALCAARDRGERERFFLSHAMSMLCCFILFLWIPTTNVRPAVPGGDLWSWLMRLIYGVDYPDNLFPSIHCLTSWLCWVGLRRRRDLPGWVRYGFLLVALMTFVTVLTTKQHVIVDILPAVLIAELCWRLAGALPLERLPFGQTERLREKKS